MISKNNGQIVLSSFILIATMLFFAWCFKVNHSTSVKLTSYHAFLTSADGLKIGSRVFSKGVEIGSVKAINLNTAQDNADVWFSLNTQLSLPEDSQLTLLKSMTGESSLDITPGHSSNSLKKDGLLKRTFSQPSLEQKISNYAFGGSVQN